jgi:hypothetical protein
VHPPKTSKGHFPGVKTLGIESNGAEAPESHCCCTSGGRLLQKERSLANRPLRLCTCPDPNNTVRESTSASDAAGLSRSINNRELDVHRHDDPPLPLSRHSWLTQPVFLYCLCMVHSRSLIDPWCTCCARPETLQALPNLQPPLRTPQRLTVVQNTQSPWHANIRGRRANTPRESIQPRNHADAHSRMVRTVEGTVVRALCRSTTTTDTRSLRAFTPMVRVVGRASTLSSSSHLLSRVAARCR